MGLFGNSFNRPGPGVPKDAPRATGLKRYFEIIGRDFGSMLKANLIVVAAFIPLMAGMCLANPLLFTLLAGVLPEGVAAEQLVPSLPLTLLSALVGGLLVGPALSGLYDTVMRALRDEPGYWWHTYKRAMKNNWKGSLLPGVIFSVLVCAELYILELLLLGVIETSTLMLVVLGLNLLLCSMVFTCLFPQQVLLNLSFGGLLKNSVFCAIGFVPRTLPAALLQLAWWAAVLLFMPFTLLLLPFLGFWPIVLGSQLMIYKPLEKTLDLENRMRQLREGQEAEG